MPTENPRITFTLSEDMRDRIDVYKHEHRIKNQTQAIVSLISKGLESLSQINVEQLVRVQASNEALMVASDFDSLDFHGQQAVRAILDVELSRASDASVAADPEPVVSVRRYCEAAAAGVPLYVEGEYEYVDYPREIVPYATDYAVGISGASMEPDYPDGCTVFVQRVNRAHDGDVVIAWIEGEGTVCKRVVAPFGRIDRLESINRAYSDCSGSQLDGMRIYGKVIGFTK